MSAIFRAIAHLRFIAEHFSRVTLGLIILGALIAAGTCGYVIIEGWSLLDAFFMTITTITTVGYGEVKPLDDAGRIYTAFLILFGVGTVFYILTALVSTIIEGDLQQVFGERRLRTKISQLSDHHIVCGYGRVGGEIALELKQRHAHFVVVDTNPEALERARKEGFLTLHGDATEEGTLTEAGIQRCASLMAASDSDSGNTYITLTAKSLRADVFVVARAGSPGNEAKMRQAGADRVVSPYQMGGRRMAVAALQPVLPEVMELVAAGNEPAGILFQLAVDDDPGLAGKGLDEVLMTMPGVVAVAVHNDRGTMIVGPAPTTHLAPGDRVLLFGSEEHVERLGRGSRRSTDNKRSG